MFKMYTTTIDLN